MAATGLMVFTSIYAFCSASACFSFRCLSPVRWKINEPVQKTLPKDNSHRFRCQDPPPYKLQGIQRLKNTNNT